MAAARLPPAGPYLPKILGRGAEVGIITTPAYQFYGFLTVEPDLRVILGPTRALRGEGRELDELLALLAVPADEREGYVQALRGAPVISAHRMAWLLSSLVTVLRGRPFPAEQVWLDVQPEDSRQSVHTDHTRQRLERADDADAIQLVRQSYAWEQLVTSYIEDGKPETLRELFSAPPRVAAGRMAQDGLRQVRNMGICTAALAARSAIRGGLDPQDAFLVSDLYIQKLELMTDPAAIERLIQEMMIDYAPRVERLRGAPGRAGPILPPVRPVCLPEHLHHHPGGADGQGIGLHPGLSLHPVQAGSRGVPQPVRPAGKGGGG